MNKLHTPHHIAPTKAEEWNNPKILSGVIFSDGRPLACGTLSIAEHAIKTMRQVMACTVIFQDESCGRGEFHFIPLWSAISGRRAPITIIRNLRKNRPDVSVILNEIDEAKAFKYWQGEK